MRQPVRYVAIGEIASPHGLRGEVKVVPLTDFPDRFARTARVLLGPPGGEPAEEPVEVERARVQGRFVLAKLARVDSVEEAARLRGRLMYVPREETEPLPEGRFYRFDLEGLSVVTEDGVALGELAAVVENPANDLFVIRPPGGGRDILIPALRSVVRKVDLKTGRMVVRLIPGLVETSEVRE